MAEIKIRKRERTNGGAVYEYRFEIASVDGQRKWISKSGYKTKGEARQAGREAQIQYENFGHVVEKDKISFADFLDYWIENDCNIDLKPNTVSGYVNTIKNHIKPKLGKYKLKSISREILQAFIIDMYDAGFSYNSITSIKGILTKSFNYAVDHHYIAYSPAVRLKTPKNRIPKVPTRSAPHVYIKKEIMEQIFERFPERHPSHIPLKLGYECGLRLGEVFGLCWDDIDFQKKLIYVNRQVQWMQDEKRDTLDKLQKNGTAESGNGYWYFAEPKYKSYRVIEISDELNNLLIREKLRQLRAKDYYGNFYTNYFADTPLILEGKQPQYPIGINRIGNNEEDFPIYLVCVRDNGTFISPRTMQHVTRSIKKDIFKDFDFHSLRHTHASMLAEIGIDQKYIQTRLGHTDVKLTIDIYEHTTDTMRERGRKAINELYM
ncbi:MAG: tyrosine-type recombinase/integrase [Clostridia bacterium]|nr:tyrosine-type recombinase/integrase [Clostridia bacterium]